MADIINFKEAWKQRLAIKTRKEKEVWEALDPNSETRIEDYEAATMMSKEIDEDFRNYSEMEAEEAQKALDEEKAKDEKLNNLIRNIISVGIPIIGGIFSLCLDHRCDLRVDKMANFEEDHAILKSSERIAVADALKKDKKSFLPFFSGK